MMDKIKSGLAFHCHHGILWEWVYDYDKRVAVIKADKPVEEQKLRLRLFQFIPEDRIPGKTSPEWKAYDKTGKAYVKAWEAYDKAWEAYDKARGACDKAGGAYVKAWEAYDKAIGQDIEQLHKELCPNCPWDGKTIFSKH